MTRAHSQDSYEIILMEYASGALDLAQRLVVAAHLNMSQSAREIVRSYECIGGALIDEMCEPVAMHANSLQCALEKLDACEQHAQAQAQRHAFPDDAPIPSCIESYIECHAHQTLHWRRIHPGIEAFVLPLDCRSSRAQMLRFGPGFAPPRPRRVTLELTLVLGGAFADDDALYNPGTLIVTESEAPAPRACDEHGGICLTVSSGPSSDMAALLARLLSPFSRS